MSDLDITAPNNKKPRTAQYVFTLASLIKFVQVVMDLQKENRIFWMAPHGKTKEFQHLFWFRLKEAGIPMASPETAVNKVVQMIRAFIEQQPRSRNLTGNEEEWVRLDEMLGQIVAMKEDWEKKPQKEKEKIMQKVFEEPSSGNNSHHHQMTAAILNGEIVHPDSNNSNSSNGCETTNNNNNNRELDGDDADDLEGPQQQRTSSLSSVSGIASRPSRTSMPSSQANYSFLQQIHENTVTLPTNIAQLTQYLTVEMANIHNRLDMIQKNQEQQIALLQQLANR